MNFQINTPLTVTYSVDKCTFPQFNGEHTETFDLSKLTNDDFEQYLAQTLIIKRQSQLRSKTAVNAETGAAKVVVGNWIVPAPGKRIATTPVEKATDHNKGSLLFSPQSSISKETFMSDTNWDEPVFAAKGTKKHCKSAMTLQTVILEGLDFELVSGAIMINVPIVTIERPNLPFIDREMSDWARTQNISETHFAEAYETAQDAFFKSLKTSAVYDYLKEHATISK
jgi:hypothetical protein